MDPAAVKEARVLLRAALEHMLHAQAALGARVESAGMVDIVLHPEPSLDALNYVLPRRNTAWVSGAYIEGGLARLRALKREPRFRYVEGLFPPQFADALASLGLRADASAAIMARQGPVQARGGALRVRRAGPGRGGALWTEARARAGWTIVDGGVLPLELALGASGGLCAADLIAYRQGRAVGVARWLPWPENGTAQVVALGLRSGEPEAAVAGALLDATARAAARAGCPLLFAATEDERGRALYAGAGFASPGILRSYAAREATEGEAADGMAQPVPAGR